MELNNQPFYWDPSKPFCMSAQTDQLDAQLALVIANIPPLQKKGRANYGSYILLDDIYDAIREPLAQNGVSCEQYGTLDGWVITRLAYNGQFIISGLKAPEDSNTKNKIQAMGGSITYLKRYSLGAIFRIATDEDTDGNEAPQQDQKKDYKFEAGRKITEAQLGLLNNLINQLPNAIAFRKQLLDVCGVNALADLEARVASEYISKLKE